MSEKTTVAVASGKGGTGKTTVSASLALAAEEAGLKTAYFDCDVEEPNGHLFLHPRFRRRNPVQVMVPEINQEKCSACGACGDICQFNAIACTSKNVLIFDKMCHSCGGCLLVCPTEAISESSREIGVVEEGNAGGLNFYHGRLNIGETMSPPLIKAVRAAGQRLNSNFQLNIIDVPPGTSCLVIASIRGVNYVILVTEPTPFGLHDLELAVSMVEELCLPYGIIVNKSEERFTMTHDFCRDKGIKILAEIPEDRRVAKAYSRALLPYHAVPGYRTLFTDLLESVLEEAGFKL